MAKTADQFRQSDVTFWAIAALAAWAIAVMLANVSGLVPASVYGALHASRLETGTLNQIRNEVADLQREADRLKRENGLLLQRFDLAERARSDVTRRVGALEVSVPQIIERLPERIAIDNSVTASVGGGKSMSFDAEGGSVRVEQKPLLPVRRGTLADNVDPAFPLQSLGDSFGVALGFPVKPVDTQAQWQNLLANVGTLLIGLWPIAVDVDGTDGQMIVAGPIATRTDAELLCDRMGKVGIPCEPVPFEGDPLPLLN